LVIGMTRFSPKSLTGSKVVGTDSGSGKASSADGKTDPIPEKISMAQSLLPKMSHTVNKRFKANNV
jgi:hypothetical protein